MKDSFSFFRGGMETRPKLNNFDELKRRIERVEMGSDDVVFAVVAPKNGDGIVSLQGSKYYLINALACACDEDEIAKILYEAVRVDKLGRERHGKEIK